VELFQLSRHVLLPPLRIRTQRKCSLEVEATSHACPNAKLVSVGLENLLNSEPGLLFSANETLILCLIRCNYPNSCSPVFPSTDQNKNMVQVTNFWIVESIEELEPPCHMLLLKSVSMATDWNAEETKAY
jgi:hypothetical protein